MRREQTIARLATELVILATDAYAADPDQVVACASDKATEADVEARTAERAAENFSRLVAPLTELRRTGEELNHRSQSAQGPLRCLEAWRIPEMADTTPLPSPTHPCLPAA